MKVALIKYNAGNVQSVEFALHRLGIEMLITNDPEEILGADKVIFPGVGNASSAMESLRREGLDSLIPNLRQPVLGICLGMQLLCEHSEENDTQGLGIIPLKVKKFTTENKDLKIPHVGWNTIHDLSSGLFKEVPESAYVYYVHSYYVEKGEETISGSHYIIPFSASIRKDNFYGVQFHTEKSGKAGEMILQNFLKLK